MRFYYSYIWTTGRKSDTFWLNLHQLFPTITILNGAWMCRYYWAGFADCRSMKIQTWMTIKVQKFTGLFRKLQWKEMRENTFRNRMSLPAFPFMLFLCSTLLQPVNRKTSTFLMILQFRITFSFYTHMCLHIFYTSWLLAFIHTQEFDICSEHTWGWAESGVVLQPAIRGR